MPCFLSMMRLARRTLPALFLALSLTGCFLSREQLIAPETADYPIKDGEVFGQGRRQAIEMLTDLYPEVINAKNFDEQASNLAGVEVVFATWGMPHLSDEQLGKMPTLEAVFYAAGNVRAFAQPIVDHGIMLGHQPVQLHLLLALQGK